MSDQRGEALLAVGESGIPDRVWALAGGTVAVDPLGSGGVRRGCEIDWVGWFGRYFKGQIMEKMLALQEM